MLAALAWAPTQPAGDAARNDRSAAIHAYQAGSTKRR
jgi:hypothetical protein